MDLMLETRPAQKTTPLQWWARVGAVFVAFQLYLFARWILSGNFTPTKSGPDPIPGWMVVSARMHEVGAIMAAVACIYWFVVRPWRRNRRLDTVGILVFACLTVYWQDTTLNWAQHTTVWNTALHNWGSWYNFIPGWIAPRGNKIAEPLLFAVPVFIPFFVVGGLAIKGCMQFAKRRRPNLGRVSLFLVACACAAVIDITIENIWLRLGVYVFAGTIPDWTLFAGHYYQFPIHETLLWAPVWAGIASMLYYRDDRGLSFVERGAETLKGPESSRYRYRFLAIAGFLNAMVVVYSLLFGVVTLQPGFRWTDDIVTRSYFRNELCGPGTPYACPGADLPVNRREPGSRIDPEGQLVVPPGSAEQRYK